YLWNPANPASVLALQRMQASAQALGVQRQPVGVQNAHDGANAFAAITHERAEAFIVSPDAFLALHSTPIVDCAAQHHLPAIYGLPNYVEVGGLLVSMAH
ncbi:MAG TPA: hypothetical protein VLQ80_29835, partial [Candidatus Saccharimonadia bacterium]|nr:hypothetical protein [Candidatus Saccharimonadia bacterium]